MRSLHSAACLWVTGYKSQKSKFLLSQAFKWGKNIFYVIPEMPSKTFVMLKKKLPDHFKNVHSLGVRSGLGSLPDLFIMPKLGNMG